MSKNQTSDWSILLHDIRSVQNVSSIFRMSECLGVKKIYLSGITPGPLDRFGRAREDFVKISLGTEKTIDWERVEDIKKLISDFKKSEGIVIGLEQNENSVDYKKVAENIGGCKINSKKYLIVPGREVEGLEKELLDMCDIVTEVPQYGNKESLNIFSAMSIVCFRFFDR